MRRYLIIAVLLMTLNAGAQIKKVYLAAEMMEIHILESGSVVEMWGYGFIKPSGAYQAEMPGPLLEFNLGDSVEIHFHNKSPEHHTIHLHGLDVSTEEDGVPMTSYHVPGWDSTVYSFVAKNTGSFLYHCHELTTLHLTMGMYGAILVHADPVQKFVYPGGPTFHDEFVFLASDMDTLLNVDPLSPGPFNQFRMNYFMINGLSGATLLNDYEHQVVAYPGDSVLLHLTSMGYSRTEFIFPPELNAIAYLSDGRVLPAPYISDTMVVFPGERYEVLLTPTAITDVDIQVNYYESRNDQLSGTNYISVNNNISVAEVDMPSFELYPNPSSSEVNFVTAEPGQVLELYSLDGKLILAVAIQYPFTNLNLGDLPAGTYVFKYADSTKKLILF